jgi:hypothetical protein
VLVSIVILQAQLGAMRSTLGMRTQATARFPEQTEPITIDSDDDDSVVPSSNRDDPGEETQGSLGTAPITITDRAGEIQAIPTMCRVVMTSRTPEGQLLFCGHPADTCTRRTHQVKQLDGSTRAELGVYEGVLNSNKKVVDGILETFQSLEARDLQTQANLAAMEALLYESARKQKAESSSHPRTPTVLSFNLDAQKEPASVHSPRQAQMASWRDTLDGPTPLSSALQTSGGHVPVEPPTTIPPPTPGLPVKQREVAAGDPTPPTLSDEVERLTAAMSHKLDLWQTQQEKMSRNLIKEVQTAIRTTAEPRSDIPRRETAPPPMNRAPSPADLPRTVRVASSRPPVGTPRRFYAVVRGRTTGILTE